jgi:hypothetical protein
LTVHVLAYSGPENPSRVLDADAEREILQRFQRTIDWGKRCDLRLGNRGGFSLSWAMGGRDFYVIVRGGVVAVATATGDLDIYADAAELESFLRVRMSEELAALDRRPSLTDLFPPLPQT